MKDKLEFIETDEHTNSDLMILALKKNVEIAKKMRKKTEELKMPSIKPNIEKEVLIISEDTDELVKKTNNSIYEKYYKKVDVLLSEICKNPDDVDEDIIKERLNYILPSLENKDYDMIIVYIMNRLFSGLTSTLEYYNMSDEEDKQEYYILMDSYNFLIELIEENKDYVKEEKPIEFIKHNVYFLTNESGKSSVIEDIKDFDPVFYPQIRKFFVDLQNGDLRKAKSISRNNNVQKGMVELKAGNHGLNQMRLIFDKVDEDSYVVYHIFKKKSDAINKTLMPTLIAKKTLYDSKKDSIIKAIKEKDPSFIAEQDILFSNLNEILNGEEYSNGRTK